MRATWPTAPLAADTTPPFDTASRCSLQPCRLRCHPISGNASMRGWRASGRSYRSSPRAWVCLPRCWCSRRSRCSLSKSVAARKFSMHNCSRPSRSQNRSSTRVCPSSRSKILVRVSSTAIRTPTGPPSSSRQPSTSSPLTPQQQAVSSFLTFLRAQAGGNFSLVCRRLLSTRSFAA